MKRNNCSVSICEGTLITQLTLAQTTFVSFYRVPISFILFSPDCERNETWLALRPKVSDPTHFQRNPRIPTMSNWTYLRYISGSSGITTAGLRSFYTMKPYCSKGGRSMFNNAKDLKRASSGFVQRRGFSGFSSKRRKALLPRKGLVQRSYRKQNRQRLWF